jgi:hypothetical protein
MRERSLQVFATLHARPVLPRRFSVLLWTLLLVILVICVPVLLFHTKFCSRVAVGHKKWHLVLEMSPPLCCLKPLSFLLPGRSCAGLFQDKPQHCLPYATEFVAAYVTSDRCSVTVPDVAYLTIRSRHDTFTLAGHMGAWV